MLQMHCQEVSTFDGVAAMWCHGTISLRDLAELLLTKISGRAGFSPGWCQELSSSGLIITLEQEHEQLHGQCSREASMMNIFL